MTEHLDDLIQVISYTPAAAKEANRVLGLSKGLVMGRPLPLKPKHGRIASVAAAALEAQDNPTLPQEPLLPLSVAKSAALERAMLLYKLLGNLHYYTPELPAQQKGRFVQLMVGALRQSAASAADFHSACARVQDNIKALER